MASYGSFQCLYNLELLSMSSFDLGHFWLDLKPVLHVSAVRVKVKGQAKCEGCIVEAPKPVRFHCLC
jgi:hypothetical protein